MTLLEHVLPNGPRLEVRGAREKDWMQYYLKSKAGLNYNTGARSLLILAGAGNGHMLMWHQVPNSRWNGNAATTMYQTSLLAALKVAYPGRNCFQILEDNEPTGFKSKNPRKALLPREQLGWMS